MSNVPRMAFFMIVLSLAACGKDPGPKRRSGAPKSRRSTRLSKAFKECRARTGGSSGSSGAQGAPGEKGERGAKGEKGDKAIPVRGISETGAIKVTRAMPVHRYALFRSMDK
jgi:hypothetical protein